MTDASAPLAKRHIADEKRCTAKAKSTQQRCNAPAVKGSDKCKVHGGLSLRGPASLSWKHGRSSRYAALLPERMREAYQRAESDSERLNMLAEISLVDARLADLMKRVDAGSANEMVNELVDGVRQVAAAMRKRQWVDAMEVMLELEKSVVAPEQDQAAWMEIWTLVDRRSRLVDAEQKRMVNLRQYVSSTDVRMLLMKVVDIVQRHVAEPRAISAILEDLRAFFTERSAQVGSVEPV